MRTYWQSIDLETTSPNKYSCDVVYTGVGLFLMGEGKITQTTKISNVPAVMHNAAFDLYILEHRQKIQLGEVHDTYLMAKHWRNDLPAYDLKSLSWWLFGDTYEPLRALREWICKNKESMDEPDDFDMSKPPIELVRAYCQHDVQATIRLARFLYPLVKDNVAYQQDIELIRPLIRMEAKGVKADVLYFKDFIRRGKRRISRNKRQASEIMGVAEGKSPTGLALQKHLGSLNEERKTATGKIRADDVVLRDHVDDDAIRSIQRLKTDQKLVKTYASNILSVVNKRGFFHPGLRQSAAITRRWRASNLYGDNGVIAKGNIQNFPRGPGIRTGIVVPDGFKLVKIDLASIEARLGAHAMSVFLDFDFYCKKYKADPKFNIYLYVIENHTEHGKVSKKDPIYTVYKHGCLGVQYGVGVNTFHKTMVEKFEMPYSFSECSHIYNTIRHECPEFSNLQRTVSNIISRQGYIKDDFGAIYYVPEEERYKGVNYYCQGCAGNLMKWWMLRVDEMMRKNKDYLWCVVHDEQDTAIWNDRGAKKRVKGYCDVLDELTLFDLPIVAEASDLVDNWAEAG